MTGLLLPFGVIPLFANAGAALLPAILAGLSSVVAVLLRPRELLRVCRERPGAVAATLAVCCALGAGVGWLRSGADHPPADDRAAVHAHWIQVAAQILHARELAAGGGARALAPAPEVPLSGPFLYRTTPARRGWDGQPAPLDLELAWSYPLEEYMFLSSPAVTGARVFGAACLLDIDGTYGTFFCLDAQSGDPLWEVEAIDADGEERPLRGFFSSPAVTADGRFVVVGQGLHADAGCDLLCFDAATGGLVWRVPTPLHLESSPAIAGDLVVIGAGAIERGESRRVDGDPGFVLAVGITDGSVRWRHAVVDPESSPVIVGDSVVIGSGFHGHALVCLRTDDEASLAAAGQGRERWRVATSQPITGAVTAIGDLILAGGGNGDYVRAAREPAGEIVAVDLATGDVRWRRDDLGDSVLGAIASDGVKAVCGLQGGDVLAVDLATGDTVWRQSLGAGTSVLAAPALTDSTVYAVASDGTLALLDSASGDLLERHHVNAPGRPGERRLCVSSPTLAGGRLFLGTETGGLRAYGGRRLRR